MTYLVKSSTLSCLGRRQKGVFSMKTIGRSIALVFMSAVIATGALTSPVGAAAPQSQPPKKLGHPKEWGMVSSKSISVPVIRLRRQLSRSLHAGINY